MDNLTHGLLGLAVGSLRRPDGDALVTRTGPATVWSSVIAAELPDLDIFYGRGNPLAEFQYHRGITHSFLLAPVVAAVATALTKLVFRKARLGPVYLFSLASVLFAHVAADLWTGWGTMALMPFSPARLGLDWASVVDPLLTLPLVAAALLVSFRPGGPERRRRVMALALAVVVAYVSGRGLVHANLVRQVAARYPQASRLQVWPGLNPVGSWGYAAVVGDSYATGTVGPVQGVREAGLVPTPDHSKPAVAAALGTASLQPLFRFTAFPVVTAARVQGAGGGGTDLTVTDLKYGYFAYRIRVDAAGRAHVVGGGESFRSGRRPAGS